MSIALQDYYGLTLPVRALIKVINIECFGFYLHLIFPVSGLTGGTKPEYCSCDASFV